MRCVLHIGTEKTATTTIQNWLYENEENLSSGGVALTRTADVNNNYKLASYFSGALDDLVFMHGIRTADERDRFYENFEAELSAELRAKSQNHHTILFTSEHLQSRMVEASHIQKLKTFLDQFFDEYTIACYFREQSEMRKSIYSTQLRIDYSGKIESFSRKIETDDHYYNFLSMFEKWESVFGLKSLKPRIFERDKLKNGDIRHDFIATACPEFDAQKLTYEARHANEALSNDTAELFSAINSVRPHYVGRFEDPLPKTLKNIVLKSDIFDHQKPISDPDQKQFYDQFNESNIAFFERYFDQKTNLFKQPKAYAETKSTANYSIAQFAQFIIEIIENSRLTLIKKHEINTLRDVVFRLKDAKQISNDEALTLLQLAHRARPDGDRLSAKIEDLLSERDTG